MLVGLAAAAAACLLVGKSNAEDAAEADESGKTAPARYLIKCRALTTGEWYLHASAGSLESAIAEAEILREKKPVRVIDREDGRVLYESTETTEYRDE